MPSPEHWLRGRTKRAIDVVGASVALLITAPVTAAVALAVRWRLGRPVLFRQERAGQDARPITVVKFRTMSGARDADGVLLPDEQRLDRFGRVLRATSLDELPQLWSVVRGDMSLVGPRPLPIVYVERYSAEQRRRLAARPGITGWAQVNGRNAVDWAERLAMDVWYVDNAGFLLDVKLVLRTVSVVLGRRGVSAEDHVTMHEFTGDG